MRYAPPIKPQHDSQKKTFVCGTDFNLSLPRIYFYGENCAKFTQGGSCSPVQAVICSKSRESAADGHMTGGHMTGDKAGGHMTGDKAGGLACGGRPGTAQGQHSASPAQLRASAPQAADSSKWPRYCRLFSAQIMSRGHVAG